jgi:hypothetical protein
MFRLIIIRKLPFQKCDVKSEKGAIVTQLSYENSHWNASLWHGGPRRNFRESMATLVDMALTTIKVTTVGVEKKIPPFVPYMINSPNQHQKYLRWNHQTNIVCTFFHGEHDGAIRFSI